MARLKRLELTIEEFADYEIKSLVASDGDRRLWVVTIPIDGHTIYRVEDRKTSESWSFEMFDQAIDQFNAI